MSDDVIASPLHRLVSPSHFRAYNLKATIDGVEYTWQSAGAIVMTSREWFVRKGTLRAIGNIIFVAEFGSMFDFPCGYQRSFWEAFCSGPTPFVPWYVYRTCDGHRLFVTTQDDIKHAIFMG